MNVMAIDQPGSSGNGSMDIRPDEQDVNSRARTTRFKDEIRMCVVLPFFIPRFPDVRFDDRAKAEHDAWAAATQFYNAYQETLVRELEQRQKAEGKRQAGPEEDLRVSELPKALQEAGDLALSVLVRDSTGEHNPHSHRWSELRYKVRLLTHRMRRQTNSTLSSILPFKFPASQKETWTDVSPISRIPSTREPSAAQDQPCDLFIFKSNFHTAADLRQGAVSRVLRLHEMFKVTTGANRARDAGYT